VAEHSVFKGLNLLAMNKKL